MLIISYFHYQQRTIIIKTIFFIVQRRKLDDYLNHSDKFCLLEVTHTHVLCGRHYFLENSINGNHVEQYEVNKQPNLVGNND